MQKNGGREKRRAWPQLRHKKAIALTRVKWPAQGNEGEARFARLADYVWALAEGNAPLLVLLVRKLETWHRDCTQGSRLEAPNERASATERDGQQKIERDSERGEKERRRRERWRRRRSCDRRRKQMPRGSATEGEHVLAFGISQRVYCATREGARWQTNAQPVAAKTLDSGSRQLCYRRVRRRAI